MRLLLAAALIAGPAPLSAVAARTIRYPEAKPMVLFEVPDDWAVTPADGGLQLASPDHTSIILAAMAKPGKADLAAFQKAAAQRMIEFGVAFDPHAEVPKASHSVTEKNRITALLGPETQPKVKAGELQPLSTMPSMALLGQAPESTIANTSGIETGDGKTAGKDGEGGKAEGGKPLHFASAVIYGATLGGKPVDVQFLNFGLSSEQSFLMQQESSGDDARAGTIIRSVRAIK